MRIGLVLNAVRLRAEGDFPEEIVCTDDDFSTMMWMADMLLIHLVEIFDLLPEEETIDTDIVMVDRHEEAEMKKKMLLDSLPEEFSTDDIHQQAQKDGLINRTVERWITQWCKEGSIERLRMGHYKKVNR